MLYSSFYDTLEQLVRLDMSNEAICSHFAAFRRRWRLFLEPSSRAIRPSDVAFQLFGTLFIGTGLANMLLDGIDIPAIQYDQEVDALHPCRAHHRLPSPC